MYFVCRTTPIRRSGHTPKATIGTKPALLMNFDKPQAEGVLSCRHYFVAEGTLAYALGFGTTHGLGVFELYERIAKTFEILPQSAT